jgi:hypothetical protein
MNIRAFKSVLERLERLYAAGGARAQAKEIRDVSSLLDGHENKTVDAYVAETKAALAADQPGQGRDHSDQDAVAVHTQRLLDAGTDQGAFDAALATLDRDDRVEKSAWFAIANQYRNLPSGATHIRKFRSIKEAREAICDVFVERFETRSKRGIIDRLTKRAS